MAKNFVFEGGTDLEVPVIAGTVSGGPVIIGMLPGVAQTDRNSSGNASCTLGRGVVNVSVTGAIASVGLPVYITSATYALVVAPGAGIQLYGHALETKGAGAGTIRVRIAHFAVASGAPA